MASAQTMTEGGAEMETLPSRSFRLRACARCSGDAYLDLSDDQPEWRCLQCGRLVAEATPVSLSAAEMQQRKAA